MVLVTVSQNASNYAIELVLEVAQIRQDQVNTRLSLLWKENTAVNDQNLGVDLKHCHVATDFAQPSQRDNPEGSGLKLRWCLH